MGQVERKDFETFALIIIFALVIWSLLASIKVKRAELEIVKLSYEASINAEDYQTEQVKRMNCEAQRDGRHRINKPRSNNKHSSKRDLQEDAI